MTKKVYKSAMGKPVDMGALLLQNENVRAVGNMNVNARGDVLDSKNTVIDRKNQQVQRQLKRQSNVSSGPVSVKKTTSGAPAPVPRRVETEQFEIQDTFEDLPEDNDVVVDPAEVAEVKGGLAAAIARSKTVKQELEKTRRQIQQESGLKKI